MRRSFLFCLLFVVSVQFGLIAPASAADAMLQADEAVADILFDYDFDASFATYTVNDSGFVSISFARDMPDEIYSEVLNKLKNTPGIKGVLAGRSLPPCNAW